MFKSLFLYFKSYSHPWRDMSFSELSEIYISQLLRTFAVSMVGIFAPLYLYKIGYDLRHIFLFMVFFLALRPIYELLSGRIIGAIGPKHTMLIATGVHIAYLGLLLTLGEYRWPLFLVATIGSFSYSLHILAVMVGFSRVKHQKHGGKELSYLAMFERIGGIFGPLIGGLLASFVDPRFSVGTAMLLLIVSLVPLFMSAEAVQTKQKIVYRGMKWRTHIWDFISVVPTTIENAVSVIAWPLYIGVFVLGANAFAKLGAIVALSTLVALVVTRYIGDIIDRRQGRKLLRISVLINAAVHIFRLGVANPIHVLGTNLVNDPVTAAYRMPYIKGMYDAADSLPGYRIAYLSAMNMVDSTTRLLFWLCMWGLTYTFDPKRLLLGSFVLAAICSVAIMTEHFAALDHKR